MQACLSFAFNFLQQILTTAKEYDTIKESSQVWLTMLGFLMHGGM